jgi:hypothetical protein
MYKASLVCCCGAAFVLDGNRAPRGPDLFRPTSFALFNDIIFADLSQHGVACVLLWGSVCLGGSRAPRRPDLSRSGRPARPGGARDAAGAERCTQCPLLARRGRPGMCHACLLCFVYVWLALLHFVRNALPLLAVSCRPVVFCFVHV